MPFERDSPGIKERDSHAAARRVTLVGEQGSGAAGYCITSLIVSPLGATTLPGPRRIRTRRPSPKTLVQRGIMPSEIERYEEALSALLATHVAYVEYACQHSIDQAIQKNVQKHCATLRSMLDELIVVCSSVN